MYWLIYRPLRTATALTRVCASVGSMLALQAIAVLNFGTTAKSTPTILPSEPLQLAGVTVPSDRLWFAGIVIVLAAVLALVYSYTRFGLATRASAENEVGAALVGLSANRIGARQLGPRDDARRARRHPDRAGLDRRPDLLHAVHRARRSASRWSRASRRSASPRPPAWRSGCCSRRSPSCSRSGTWLPEQGLPQAMPFLLIMVAMTLLSRGVGARGVGGRAAQPVCSGARRGRTRRRCACFVVGVVALLVLHGSLRAAFMASIVSVCLALSLVVLTGYVGQVSLAQMSFAGVSAFALSHLADGAGIPFPSRCCSPRWSRCRSGC